MQDACRNYIYSLDIHLLDFSNEPFSQRTVSSKNVKMKIASFKLPKQNESENK